MYYIIRGKNTIGYTEDKAIVDKLMSSPWASLMEYRVEVVSSRPQHLDRLA